MRLICESTLYDLRLKSALAPAKGEALELHEVKFLGEKEYNKATQRKRVKPMDAGRSGILSEIEDFIFISHEPKESDIIFLPGGAHPEPAERAAALWKDGFAPLVMPSGNFYKPADSFGGVASKADVYSGAYASEWEFYTDVLVKSGVDERAVLCEKAAGNTYENAKLSREVLDAAGITAARAIVCCKASHARRCWMYYQYFFPETEILVCPSDTPDIGKATWRGTEKGLRAVLGEVRKCGEQFEMMFTL